MNLTAAIFLLTIACCCARMDAADVIVVRPAAWQPALERWKAYRETQGYRIIELDSAATAQEIRTAIKKIAQATVTPHSILLTTDCGVLADKQIAIPTCYHPSTALIKFGGDAEIASDSTYGDLNDDNLPDIAVGRIPADSAEQLTRMLDRTIAFEQSQDASQWRRDIHVIAGVGGFGALADGAIELTTRRFLADRIPGWADLTMTQASPRSLYCPDPWQFSATAIRRMNQGSMFWIYIGHGHVKTLDFLRCNNEWLPIMTHEHLAQVDTGSKSPVALFLACYTGAFDAVDDSLAEQLVTHERGAIASIAASRVSGPYGLAMLSSGMLTECFEHRTGTLGTVLLNAKRTMMQPPKIQPVDTKVAGAKDYSQLLNALASALSPEGYDLQAERQEHVWMMNLLGDPLLKINYPDEVLLQQIDSAKPGELVHVRGTSPIAGSLRIELAYRRDQSNPNLAQPDAFSPDEANRERAQQTYNQANARVLAFTDQAVAAGEFNAAVQVPSDLPRGKYCIRALVTSPAPISPARWAAGYQTLSIRP